MDFCNNFDEKIQFNIEKQIYLINVVNNIAYMDGKIITFYNRNNDIIYMEFNNILLDLYFHQTPSYNKYVGTSFGYSIVTNCIMELLPWVTDVKYIWLPAKDDKISLQCILISSKTKYMKIPLLPTEIIATIASHLEIIDLHNFTLLLEDAKYENFWSLLMLKTFPEDYQYIKNVPDCDLQEIYKSYISLPFKPKVNNFIDLFPIISSNFNNMYFHNELDDNENEIDQYLLSSYENYEHNNYYIYNPAIFLKINIPSWCKKLKHIILNIFKIELSKFKIENIYTHEYGNQYLLINYIMAILWKDKKLLNEIYNITNIRKCINPSDIPLLIYSLDTEMISDIYDVFGYDIFNDQRIKNLTIYDKETCRFLFTNTELYNIIQSKTTKLNIKNKYRKILYNKINSLISFYEIDESLLYALHEKNQSYNVKVLSNFLFVICSIQLQIYGFKKCQMTIKNIISYFSKELIYKIMLELNTEKYLIFCYSCWSYYCGCNINYPEYNYRYIYITDKYDMKDIKNMKKIDKYNNEINAKILHIINYEINIRSDINPYLYYK